jgi:hypothetical protein
MGESMCQFQSSLKEIEYYGEFVFWIFAMPSLSFFCFCKFVEKVFFSTKLCSLKKLLYYVTTWKILWEWVQ